MYCIWDCRLKQSFGGKRYWTNVLMSFMYISTLTKENFGRIFISIPMINKPFQNKKYIFQKGYLFSSIFKLFIYLWAPNSSRTPPTPAFLLSSVCQQRWASTLANLSNARQLSNTRPEIGRSERSYFFGITKAKIVPSTAIIVDPDVEGGTFWLSM